MVSFTKPSGCWNFWVVCFLSRTNATTHARHELKKKGGRVTIRHKTLPLTCTVIRDSTCHLLLHLAFLFPCHCQESADLGVYWAKWEVQRLLVCNRLDLEEKFARLRYGSWCKTSYRAVLIYIKRPAEWLWGFMLTFFTFPVGLRLSLSFFVLVGFGYCCVWFGLCGFVCLVYVVVVFVLCHCFLWLETIVVLLQAGNRC